MQIWFGALQNYRLQQAEMFAKQWRSTHIHTKRSQMRISGNEISCLHSEPSPQTRFIINTSNPEFEKLASFRESKRYNSKEFEGRIRERIINRQSMDFLPQKQSPKELPIKLPKIIITGSPPKQLPQSKKEFVLNFCRKGRILKLRKKRQSTIH